jgi:C-terminal processing protease CtpA/Prc
MAGYPVVQVRLCRDSFNTPFGFRLQGGADLRLPLTIQRVFTGSPSEGLLQRGDVIVSLDNYDATQLSYRQAQEIIKGAGGQLLLGIRR